MSIYEAIGMSWVILTSLLATAAIFYLAFIGIRVLVRSGKMSVKETPEPASGGIYLAGDAQ